MIKNMDLKGNVFTFKIKKKVSIYFRKQVSFEERWDFIKGKGRELSDAKTS